MRYRSPSILQHLSALQAEHGWLREDDLRALGKRLGVPLYRIEGVASFYPHFRRTPPAAHTIELCRDLSCLMAGGEDAKNNVYKAAAAHEAATGECVEIREVSCLGRCDRAPAALVHHDTPVIAPSGVAAALRGDDATPPAITAPDRFTLDPYDRPEDRYSAARRIAAGGDAAADEVLAAIKDAGLRGMGGAGFPTAMKWGFVRGAGPGGGGEKFVICNADESEPGTFKDREILGRLPHLVWEGVLIAALVVRAQRGIVYIRHEYEPERAALERERLGAAAVAAELGVDLEIFVSPGGYIMGEETALLEALEDRRGEPRNKPPFPGIEGLFGLPTLINNVETLAMATAIAARGSAWWKGLGVRGCAGVKVMAISGDIAVPGVYEVPMGTTVAELIDRAGGVAGGEALLAFQPGGASSAFLPGERADTPLDFDALRKAGSTLGSGAMVIVAAGRDLLALGVSLTRFFRNESCGKCVPCRVGSQKGVEILEAMAAGGSTDPQASLELLGDLDQTMAQTSICGLGQVALLPAISILKGLPGAMEAVPRRRPSLKDRAE